MTMHPSVNLEKYAQEVREKSEKILHETGFFDRPVSDAEDSIGKIRRQYLLLIPAYLI